MSRTEEAVQSDQSELAAEARLVSDGRESAALESAHAFGPVAFDPMVFEAVPPELIARVKAMLAEARPVSSN